MANTEISRLQRYDPTPELERNFRGIIDVSLREGEQFAGRAHGRGETVEFEPVEFTVSQAEQILKHLADIGVEYSEVSNPVSEQMYPFVRQLVALPDRPRLLAHIRNHPRDIKAAIESGVEGVNVLTTVDPKRLTEMNTTMDLYLDRLQEVVLSAKDHDLETRVSVEHGWQMCYEEGGFDRMLQVYRLGSELGVNRIAVADTLGIADSHDVKQVVSFLAHEFPDMEKEVHFHADAGAQITNAYEAVLNGANWVDTSLAGLGERTGITPLSGFIARLKSKSPSVVAKYHTEHLTEAEEYMASIYGLPVPHNLVTAPNAFAHRAGIHLDLLKKFGPGAYEALSPGDFGNRRFLVANGSRISGRTSQADVQNFYEHWGVK